MHIINKEGLRHVCAKPLYGAKLVFLLKIAKRYRLNCKLLLQKHEESSENIENESAEPSNDVENYDSVEAPSEDTEATSVDNEDNTEDSVQESTEEKSEENTSE